MQLGKNILLLDFDDIRHDIRPCLLTLTAVLVNAEFCCLKDGSAQGFAAHETCRLIRNRVDCNSRMS